MLDHVFTDAIGALRDAMENALLERQAFEERFQVDVLLGDVTWETSYGLPGEGSPPRVRADLTVDWPTWSQTAYRNWYIGEPDRRSARDPHRSDVPRCSGSSTGRNRSTVLAVLPEASPSHRQRESSSVRHQPSSSSTPTIWPSGEFAIEVSYEGTIPLEERPWPTAAPSTSSSRASVAGLRRRSSGWVT
jgi:hypothetical protein